MQRPWKVVQGRAASDISSLAALLVGRSNTFVRVFPVFRVNRNGRYGKTKSRGAVKLVCGGVLMQYSSSPCFIRRSCFVVFLLVCHGIFSLPIDCFCFLSRWLVNVIQKYKW